MDDARGRAICKWLTGNEPDVVFYFELFDDYDGQCGLLEEWFSRHNLDFWKLRKNVVSHPRERNQHSTVAIQISDPLVRMEFNLRFG